MKAKGKPFGQAFGHTINDPNHGCYPLVWMWGGMEVDNDGRTVALNSKNTVEAVKFNTMLWKEGFDEGGLAWDDSNNNRAFLSQEISLTGNAPSIYVAAAASSPTSTRAPTTATTRRAGGALLLAALLELVRDEVRKNQKVAKDFIRFYMDRAQFDRYFETMDTFGIPGTQDYRDHPLWRKDPRTAVFPETLQYARQVGYAGPPGRKATEALSEVHHRRHVRQGHPGHEAGRRGGVGGGRTAQDLRGVSDQSWKPTRRQTLPSRRATSGSRCQDSTVTQPTIGRRPVTSPVV